MRVQQREKTSWSQRLGSQKEAQRANREAQRERVDTNALRRVGVELDDVWGQEQAGNNIMNDNAAEAAQGTRELCNAAD